MRFLLPGWFRRIVSWLKEKGALWRYGPEYTILVDDVPIATVRTKKASLDVEISPGMICGPGKVTVLGPKQITLKVMMYYEAV